MKKLFMFLILILCFIACGKKYKTYTMKEKYEMIVTLDAIEKKKDLTPKEEEFKTYMRNLLTGLKMDSQTDEKARKEFFEWREAVAKFQEEEMKKIHEEAVKESKKTNFQVSF